MELTKEEIEFLKKDIHIKTLQKQINDKYKEMHKKVKYLCPADTKEKADKRYKIKKDIIEKEINPLKSQLEILQNE